MLLRGVENGLDFPAGDMMYEELKEVVGLS